MILEAKPAARNVRKDRGKSFGPAVACRTAGSSHPFSRHRPEQGQFGVISAHLISSGSTTATKLQRYDHTTRPVNITFHAKKPEEAIPNDGLVTSSCQDIARPAIGSTAPAEYATTSRRCGGYHPLRQTQQMQDIHGNLALLAKAGRYIPNGNDPLDEMLGMKIPQGGFPGSYQPKMKGCSRAAKGSPGPT